MVTGVYAYKRYRLHVWLIWPAGERQQDAITESLLAMSIALLFSCSNEDLRVNKGLTSDWQHPNGLVHAMHFNVSSGKTTLVVINPYSAQLALIVLLAPRVPSLLNFLTCMSSITASS